MLKQMMDNVNTYGEIDVVLTPGRYNAAFFEHSYLAERSGAILAMPPRICLWRTITSTIASMAEARLRLEPFTAGFRMNT